MIINLTPHEIVVMSDDNKIVETFKPSGTVARCATKTKQVGSVDNIALYVSSSGNVEGLPEPQPNTMYIVSLVVRQAAPARADLASPGELVRDANGKPIGCRGLTVNPTWKPAETTPQRVEYSDELVWAGTGGGSNRHTPTLIFFNPLTGEKPVKFLGASIPSVCRVVREKYHKNGKWSYTEYVIDVAPGLEPWMLKAETLGRVIPASDTARTWYDPKTATNRYNVTSWSEVKSPEAVVRFFKFARQLDENEMPV